MTETRVTTGGEVLEVETDPSRKAKTYGAIGIPNDDSTGTIQFFPFDGTTKEFISIADAPDEVQTTLSALANETGANILGVLIDLNAGD